MIVRGAHDRVNSRSCSPPRNTKTAGAKESEGPGGDILRLQRTIGNRAVVSLLDGSAPAPVQRAFAPAVVNSKAHLRARAGGGVDPKTKTGRAIPKNAEIVVDPAQTAQQARRIRRDVTWTRAVDTTAGNWDPATDPNQGGYIRQSRFAPSAYPKTGALDIGSRGHFDVERRWHEAVGEYLAFENSAQTPADQIVKVAAGFRRMTAAHQLVALTPLELTQVDDVSREHAAEQRLTLILTQAANARGLNPALFTTAHNIGAQKDDGSYSGLKHPLRLTTASGAQRDKNRWYEWSQAVFAKIAQGAGELVDSIVHWRATVYPGNPGLCTVTRVEMEGSDLHDRGLGAVFVTYDKPSDATGMFPNVASVRVVIKPEDRSIEKALFGTQGGSLANVVNAQAGLGAADAIATIKMETHAAYGSIIEFVQGQQAKAINNTGADSQAMSEGIAFAFLAGMSDVHQDNVIYHNGKPYFIDADNSLNAARLNQASSQTGFSMYNQARTTTDIAHINNNPGGSRSAIIQALLANSIPLLQGVQNAFQGRVGRVVPLYTNFWANQLKMNGYITADVGLPTDDLATAASVTRWGIVNDCANRLPRGGAAQGTGLQGESGIASTGENYDRAAAKLQIKADLDQGKIPFFNYDYTTGHVTQNGQVIWDGQSLADAMVILMTKFPPPPLVLPLPPVPVPVAVGGGGGGG